MNSLIRWSRVERVKTVFWREGWFFSQHESKSEYSPTKYHYESPSWWRRLINELWCLYAIETRWRCIFATWARYVCFAHSSVGELVFNFDESLWWGSKMSKCYVGVPDTKFHENISPRYCFSAEKLTFHELGKSWVNLFPVNPMYI